jgi:hypothetical protein
VNIVRWETAVSDMTSLTLISLHHEGCLKVILEGTQAGGFEQHCFTFKRFFAYRSLREEYRTALWNNDVGLGIGWTRLVLDSPWVQELRTSEPLFGLHGGADAVHYLFCSEDDVVDVLAHEPPTIEPI